MEDKSLEVKAEATPESQDSDHYKGAMESIDIISHLTDVKAFCKGNIIKYATRAGKKSSQSKEKDAYKVLDYACYIVFGEWYHEQKEHIDAYWTSGMLDTELNIAKTLGIDLEAFCKLKLFEAVSKDTLDTDDENDIVLWAYLFYHRRHIGKYTIIF